MRGPDRGGARRAAEIGHDPASVLGDQSDQPILFYPMRGLPGHVTGGAGHVIEWGEPTICTQAQRLIGQPQIQALDTLPRDCRQSGSGPGRTRQASMARIGHCHWNPDLSRVCHH